MATVPIHSAYRRTWWALVIRGLLALAVGVLILWRPIDSIASFALVIAIWALFTGVVDIVHAFDLRPVYDKWWVPLVSGLVSAAFGLAALYYYPILSLTFAVVWVSTWLIVAGALAIYAAMVERRVEVPWGWTLTVGILSIVAGVFALIRPQASLAVIMSIIAAFAIVSGVALLMGAYRLTTAKEGLTEAVRAARG